MGIYISRMEMPNPGQIVLVEIDENGNVFAAYDGGRTKLAQYTAIPVPPHGRLGDLDKLVEKINGIWDCNVMVFSPDDHCCNVPEDCKGCKWAQTRDFIQRMVENAHTIIPAEENDG